MVAVDVVGKYRYEVVDATGTMVMPVIVDVILVGRTKILKVHSTLWLENQTGMRLGFRLKLAAITNGG